MSSRSKVYEVAGSGPLKDPDYGRLARSLTDAELEDEILQRRGGFDYQAALVSELDHRAATGVPDRPPVTARLAFDSDDWGDAA